MTKNKTDFVNYIKETLNKVCPTPNTSLIFTKTPYTFLISVLLSARCRDAVVNKVATDLFAIADSPETMIKINLETLKNTIFACGLSSNKAKNILMLSKIIHEKYNDIVPNTSTDLESLPGIGHKSASVVLGQIFNVPTFPVDTHVSRLAQKWHLSSSNNVKTIEKDLKKIFNEKDWFKIHLQLIHFGRFFCNHSKCTKTHKCIICSKI